MSPSERIYALVPAIYRQRDAALGRPLEALCQVLDLEYTNLSADIAGLYAQWFIETCEDWVVPYIGDLVGTTGIETAVANVATQRARVANTLGYRSRRGVAATVANACADASGWAALPVEYFRRLVTSVNVGALGRVSSKPAGLGVATLALNSPADLQYLDGPFSTARRTVAVTAIDEPRVRVSGTTAEDYNLANLGVFLWRIPASPISDADPGHGPSRRYLTFHPLGVDTPLLRAPRGRTSPWVASGPDNVPLWISRALLETWTQMWRESRAPAAGLAAHELPELGFTIRVDGHPIPAHAIYVPEHADEDERQWPARVKEPQHAVFAVVDPERGRFVVGGREPSTPDGAGAKHRVTVDWAWGQAGSIGGGPYDREHSSVGEVEGAKVLLVSQRLGAHHDAIRVFRHLQDALDAVLTCREPTPGVEASEPRS